MVLKDRKGKVTVRQLMRVEDQSRLRLMKFSLHSPLSTPVLEAWLPGCVLIARTTRMRAIQLISRVGERMRCPFGGEGCASCRWQKHVEGGRGHV